MPLENNSGLSRRGFVAGGGAALAGAALGAQQKGRLRIAQVGTGGRGTHWGGDLVQNYKDVATIVGLCDINAKRVEVAKRIIGADAPTYVDFDKMIQETNPDIVLVTPTDSAHAGLIIRERQFRPLKTEQSRKTRRSAGDADHRQADPSGFGKAFCFRVFSEIRDSNCNYLPGNPRR